MSKKQLQKSYILRVLDRDLMIYQDGSVSFFGTNSRRMKERKRNRFRSVILSASEGSLSGERSFAGAQDDKARGSLN